jgi:hypothetical protein
MVVWEEVNPRSLWSRELKACMFNDVVTLVVDLRECGKLAVLPFHYKLEFTLRLRKTRKISLGCLNRVGHKSSFDLFDSYSHPRLFWWTWFTLAKTADNLRCSAVDTRDLHVVMLDVSKYQLIFGARGSAVGWGTVLHLKDRGFDWNFSLTACFRPHWGRFSL